MRLIDADKLHYIKVWIANGYDVKKDIVVFAKEIDKIAKKTECFGKWIPVTERMPEENEYGASEEVFVMMGRGKYVTYSTDFTQDGIWCCNHSITHWMPIPEPPEEEE